LNSSHPPFQGFKPDTFNFLKDLGKDKNNNLKWFSKNRPRYDENLVLPVKSFVAAIGQFFNHLNPGIRTEPKFTKTITRINKDMRFAKGSPYRNYMLIHFGRFKMDNEFFVYLNETGIEYGIFLNNTSGDDLYFKQNISSMPDKIIYYCEKFRINNKFGFYELYKNEIEKSPRFNAKRDFELFSRMKYIILQKNKSLENKLCYSPNFLTEAIKAFSNLYPLYCFAISPQPEKLIDDFEDRLGVAV